jgi:hypothetical protein
MDGEKEEIISIFIKKTLYREKERSLYVEKRRYS